MKLTVDAIMNLNPCPDYPAERVEALVQRLSTETPFEVLSSIPVEDAYWFLLRALSVPNLVVWAEACAERARGYAYAAGAAARYDAEYAAANARCAADDAARYATSFSRYAADAARNAARAAHAAEYAARAPKYTDAAQYADAEHRLAVEHGVRLMGAK